MPANIPGYTYGTEASAKSPLSESALQELKSTILFTDEDKTYLRQAGEVLSDQIEEVLDLWYGFVGSHPHLLAQFHGKDGAPDDRYLKAVRLRFGQWIRDTCSANYDQKWLDYQQEIALRHTSARKNQTDGVQSASNHIPLRYMVAFIYPITATIRPFLGKKGHSATEVEKMHQAWFKSIVLQVALWCEPYAKPGSF
ncbi:MAG: protoglobin domain-containing protein [Acidobacteriota bacterium]